MKYDVDLRYSILGASSCSGIDEETGELLFHQAALVVVKEPHNPYGMRVFLGCSGASDEREIYQDVAGRGDEIPYDLIKSLYLTMTKNLEEANKKSFDDFPV